MANLASVVQQLKMERDQLQRRLEQLDQALQALGGLSGLRRSGSRGRKFVRTRRKMSAAARRRIVAAQRARWAKWRAGKRGRKS
jgi:hypothetical protein